MWLQGDVALDLIMAALRKVLLSLWLLAWKDGAKAASLAIGGSISFPDQMVADRIARFQAKWLQEVTDTRMRAIAAILAKGGTAAELETAIKAVLVDQGAARLIAVTEVTRAMNAAALEVYRAASVNKVRWVTRSANPCPTCLANEAAGTRYLGEPFPSGSTAPPEHPNCECVLIPAED